MRPPFLSLPLALSALLVVAPAPARAGNAGAAVSIFGQGIRVPLLTVAESDSGALVIVVDTRTGVDLYAQRLDRHGHPLLGASGAHLLSDDPNNFDIQEIADGVGGVILVQDLNRGASGRDIVAWRVAPDGSMAYGTNGVVVCSATRDQTRPFLVAGPAGYYYVAWTDDRANLGGTFDIYAQKLSVAGVPQWAANGQVINAAAYRPWSYGIDAMISDLQGGFIATWTYNSYGGPTRAQRVSSAGALQWTATGLDFGDPSYGARGIAADGLGGVWGTMNSWNGTTTSFYAYHMLGGGTPAFSGGVQFMPAQYNGQSVVVRDAAGGCFIYTAFTGSSSQTTAVLYKQELSSSGALLLGSYGEYFGQGSLPTLADAGSAFLMATREPIFGSTRLQYRVQKLALDGSSLLPGMGVILGRDEGFWLDIGGVPALSMSTAGVVAAAWPDTRYTSPSNPSSVQAFGQAFASTGSPLWDDSEVPSILTVHDAAADQGGFLRTTWASGTADDPAARALRGYRVWRALPAGAAAAQPGLRPSPDGLFRIGARTFLSLASTYWELGGEQPAATLPGYALTVPTLMDSTAAGSADQSYMVEAYDDSSHHWFSGTLVGHSVDNLAPGAVSSAIGIYSGGATSLFWGAVPDADLSSYEVFRGSSPLFVPNDADRIGSTTQLTWRDPLGGPSFYRIAARDVHGNLGPSVLVLPAGTLAVDPAAPLTWRLRSAWRSGALELALDVPRADNGRIELFDVAGRRLWGLPFHTDAAQSLTFRATANELEPGLYCVRAISTTGHPLTSKVVVTR